jgi:hypothetical protein
VARSGRFPSAQREPQTFHVRRYRSGWAVFADERSRPLAFHDREEHAVQLAMALAKRANATVAVGDEVRRVSNF